MTAILITYGTGEGQTAKVADYIDAVLSQHGFDVTTLHVSDAGDVEVGEFDGVLVGGSINNRRVQPEVVTFVDQHVGELASRPSGFFQLSLASVFTSSWARNGAQQYVDDLVRTTGWNPDVVGLFAGALKYTQYDRPERWLFRVVAFVLGLGSDSSRDYEYTDWNQVARFAEEFGDHVEAERERGVLADPGESVSGTALTVLALAVVGAAYWAVKRRGSPGDRVTVEERAPGEFPAGDAEMEP
ncbi:flavodoxin domain-containing protein [Halobacterium wangiae]|uniref:flavodoxin domain-containing protein n=1 Tax=Halobacterium wangiae TaxID=2902623 RepID=UPI001E5AB987|nr:flavodoxin domain-containing protein [Halobacterium wangiae]